MNILVPSVPKILRITQMMWEDFLCDPVLACQVIMGFELDAFQAARLKYYWWCHEVIDSSGVSTGKTFCAWIFLNLRCILLPEHHAGAFFQVFEVGKSTFWPYYKKCKSRMFHAQLGGLNENEDEVAKTSHGSAAWMANFKAGGTLAMPAPGAQRDMLTQAGKRFHDLFCDEFGHIDQMGEGIDEQLKGRASMKNWNDNHPVWGNHILMTCTAKTKSHPAWRRVRELERRVAKGDPRCASLHYSFKDHSNMPMGDGTTFKTLRSQNSKDSQKASLLAKGKWLGEGLGFWTSSGKGWFTEEALDAAQQRGAKRGLLPVASRAEYESLRMATTATNSGGQANVAEEAMGE